MAHSFAPSASPTPYKLSNNFEHSKVSMRNSPPPVTLMTISSVGAVQYTLNYLHPMILATAKSLQVASNSFGLNEKL